MAIFCLLQSIELTKTLTGVEGMKTIRQIAEEIGIDKQRVYRYIKGHGITSHQKNGVMCFDDTTEMRIRQHFLKIGTSRDIYHEASPNISNDTVISILEKELEFQKQIINEQQQTIKELTATIKVQAGNASHKPQKERAYSRKKLAAPKAKSAVIERHIEGKK